MKEQKEKSLKMMSIGQGGACERDSDHKREKREN